MYKLTSANVFILFVAILLTGCASHYNADVIADPYGFFSGIWHGMIAPITILVNLLSWFLSLFDISFLRDIQIIGRPNTGFFYYFGFFIGFVFLPISGQ